MRQHHWYHSDHPMLGKNQHPMSMEHQQLDIPGSKIIMLEMIKKIADILCRTFFPRNCTEL